MKRLLGTICTASGLLLGVASPAAAQWYASPFIGKITNITFDQGAASDATALGIAAGTAPRGLVGLELEFMHAADVFTSGQVEFDEDNFFFEDPVLKSRLRTFTVSAQAGYPLNLGRVLLRPYGVIGGGLGMYQRTVVEEDFETFFNLPFQEQDRIDTCVFTPPLPTTSDGLIGRFTQCGKPTLEESESAAAAMLNVGGGAILYLTSHVGVRADFRYVTQIVPSEEKLTFFRSVVAVVVH